MDDVGPDSDEVNHDDEKRIHEAVAIQSDDLPNGANPQEWPTWRKWTFIVLVAYCDCLTFLVSMMLAPSVPQVLATFRPNGGDKSLGSFCVTVYILGFCVGPLLLAPLTDIYGRTILYRICIVAYIALTVGCALSPSLEALIMFRFFAGCFGGAPMAIGGAVIADLYPPGKRAGPMACYSAGTMLGPTLGPVLGGVITGRIDWRWVFWIAAMPAGVGAIGLFLVLPETHLPTLRRRAARKVPLRSAPALPQRTATEGNSPRPTVWRNLAYAVRLPARIAFHHLPCFLILLLICAFNGLVNMILSSLGSVYQTVYHFPANTAGLAYLGMAFGGLVALAVAKRLTALVARSIAGVRNEGRPENALPFLFLVGPIGSIGLVWYGWSLQQRVHWIVPILGLFLFGFTYMSVRLCTQLFLVEAVPNYSASALATHTVASSVGGAVVPLATFPLYDTVGYGWGNTTIALLNLGLCAIPLTMFLLLRRRGDQLKVDVRLE